MNKNPSHLFAKGCYKRLHFNVLYIFYSNMVQGIGTIFIIFSTIRNIYQTRICNIKNIDSDYKNVYIVIVNGRNIYFNCQTKRQIQKENLFFKRRPEREYYHVLIY